MELLTNVSQQKQKKRNIHASEGLDKIKHNTKYTLYVNILDT